MNENGNRDNLADWLTEADAAERLGMSVRTLQRRCDKGEGPERRERQRPGVRPEPVYNPEDVARMEAPKPHVMPEPEKGLTTTAPEYSNGLTTMPTTAPESEKQKQELALVLHALAPLILKRLQEPPPKIPAVWLTLKAASARSGLSVALLRHLIAGRRLYAIRDRAVKVLQADLDNLDKADMQAVHIGGIGGNRVNDNPDRAGGVDGIVVN